MSKELKKQNDSNEFKCKIVKKIVIISVNSKWLNKEVNLVSYIGKNAFVDIRLWSPSKKMSKGITIDKKDLNRLIELLKEVEKKEIK